MKERQFNELMGSRLKEIRKRSKVSQEELGKLIGVHQTAVCRIEQGSQSLTPLQLVLILKRFQVGFEDFVPGDE